MELLSVKEAAERKKCSVQAIRDALATEKIKGQQVGRSFIVQVDRLFEDWAPNLKRQVGAKRGWKTR